MHEVTILQQPLTLKGQAQAKIKKIGDFILAS